MMMYIKYRLLLQEPVRIADDSSAKQGQTLTKRYIPGSTVRGFVINRLASESYFPEIKKELFSEHVRFQNAYMSVNSPEGEQILIPSPKGFYEDKSITEGEKELQNVVINGEFDEAFKRARLGTNIFLDMSGENRKDTIVLGRMYTYTPKVLSDTKIRLGQKKEQDIFRSTSIQAGYRFTGYIALDNADMAVGDEGADSVTLADVVKNALSGEIMLGNARSSGSGKCIVEYNDLVSEFPYASLVRGADTDEDERNPGDVQISGKKNNKKECYMMLLSDMVMRNSFGEYCGIDVPVLERILGVSDLRVQYCATTVTDIRGFNRHYGGAVSSVPMYEKGSVFHLTYDGVLDREHLEKIHRNGIGVRRNEGYGQVLLIKEYENIRFRVKGLSTPKDSKMSSTAVSIPKVFPEDAEVIRNAARLYYLNCIHSSIREYIVRNPMMFRHTSSQLGNILSIAMENRFTPEAGWGAINKYYQHKIEKESNRRVHSTGEIRTSDPLYNKVIKVIENRPLHELLNIQYRNPAEKTIMGIRADDLLTGSEEKKIRLELLIQLIRYDFKKEVKA